MVKRLLGCSEGGRRLLKKSALAHLDTRLSCGIAGALAKETVFGHDKCKRNRE